MNGNEVALREGSGAVTNFEEYAMPVESLVKQVCLVHQVMEKVMQKDEHYGVIPGTKKPTLYKPGAEKLCLVFRLSPTYDIIREVRDKEFLAYTIRCTLTHIVTGQVIATGIGACNSREDKYLYRNDFELTDQEVPKSYWTAKKAANNAEMKRLIGGGNVAKRNEETGKWVVAKAVRKINENPWDLDNTIVKMACKRSLIAAVLNGTAASDIFTQDIEPTGDGTQEPEPEPMTKPQAKEEPAQAAPAGDVEMVSDNQIKAIHATLKVLGVDDDLERHKTVAAILGLAYDLASFSTLTKAQASQAIKKLSKDADAKRRAA